MYIWYSTCGEWGSEWILWNESYFSQIPTSITFTPRITFLRMKHAHYVMRGIWFRTAALWPAWSISKWGGVSYFAYRIDLGFLFHYNDSKSPDKWLGDLIFYYYQISHVNVMVWTTSARYNLIFYFSSLYIIYIPYTKSPIPQDHPHRRLWKLLAEAALDRREFGIAEKAFVRSGDYAGLCLVRQLLQVGGYWRRERERERESDCVI